MDGFGGFGAEGSMALIWASNGLSWVVGVGLQIALLGSVALARPAA
ncbi:MAG: hypothetical protein M0R80_15990 [Proteobacteria bacterium]|jgi:hypothetical protein|nr:hypothetical protein [Pseudomonadota bacterium]